MKLITKEIAKRLAKYPIYSQDGKGGEAIVNVKFFCPMRNWTWYVLEAEQHGSDYEFYGIVVNDYGAEYGYFTLSQLEEIKLYRGAVRVERDMYFDPVKVSELHLKEFAE